jgi:hypothetical protein
MAAGLGARGARAASISAPVQVKLGLGKPTASPPIPSSFIGLSLEYSAVVPYAGADPRAIDPVFVQLVRNLAPGQSPVLRIGGNSTDWSWWPVAGMRRPLGIRYDITKTWTAVTKSLTKVLNARLILGINLEADSTRIAATEASALLRGLDRRHILALEIGNEPELYAPRPWYDPPGGPVVRGRPPGYDFNSYLSDFGRIRKALPSMPLAGPAMGNYSWFSNLPRFLSAEPQVRIVTFHRYGLNRCVKTHFDPHYPTVPALLSRFASRLLMNGVDPLIAVAHRRHELFRVDEMNSVTCGGVLGISNSFATALWSIDALFTMARDGVDGVNIHTYPRGYNELFDFARVHGRWATTTVRPEYYGLWMFAQAAPPGARLLQIAGGDRDQALRAWATRGLDGRTRVILINDSTSRAYSVTLRARGDSADGTVERLQAPSAYATSRVKIGGRTFGSRTTTGRLGPPHLSQVAPAGGSYRVALPASSAALLTIPTSQT